MDFTLIDDNTSLDLKNYYEAIGNLLIDLGLIINIVYKDKNIMTNVASSYVRVDMRNSLNQLGYNKLANYFVNGEYLSVKFEIDLKNLPGIKTNTIHMLNDTNSNSK